jgi:hypothetical protein
VGLGVVGTSLLGLVFTVQSGDPRWLFLALPFTLALFFIGRFAPAGYRLAGDGLHIDRRTRARIVPYRRIRAVDRQARPLRGISLGASEGVFGHFGRFWNPTLGVYRLCLSNRESVVWLDTDDGWLGISPDRPDEFVDRLRSHLELRS